MFPIELIPHVKDFFPTGSRVICDPPVFTTDEDWAVLIHGASPWAMEDKELALALTANGFVKEGQEQYNSSKFHSWRCDANQLNLIVFNDNREYEKYKLATRIATVLNLTHKPDRIKLFEMIRNAQ